MQSKVTAFDAKDKLDIYAFIFHITLVTRTLHYASSARVGHSTFGHEYVHLDLFPVKSM